MQRRFSSNTVDFVARCKAAERRVEGRDTEQHRCMFADGRLLSFLSFFSSSRSLNGSKINKRKMTNFNHRALLFFLRLLLPFICLWNETLLVFLRIPWPRFTAWPVLQFVRKQIEMWRRQRERRMRSKRRESVCRGWAGWAERRWKAEKTKRWAVHKTKVAFTPQQPVWPPCRSCCAFFFFYPPPSACKEDFICSYNQPTALPLSSLPAFLCTAPSDRETTSPMQRLEGQTAQTVNIAILRRLLTCATAMTVGSLCQFNLCDNQRIIIKKGTTTSHNQTRVIMSQRECLREKKANEKKRKEEKFSTDENQMCWVPAPSDHLAFVNWWKRGEKEAEIPGAPPGRPPCNRGAPSSG